MTMVAPTEAHNAAASELMKLSGLDLVSELASRAVRPPPMAETLPFTLLPPKEGEVRLIAVPEERFCNLTNTIHGGWIMTMLDTAMALAAQTTLSAGEACPSHETSVKFVRPILPNSDAMHVLGRMVS